MSTPADLARVAVRILDKEYFIVCPPEERKDLQQSADYLNAKMREIRDTGKFEGETPKKLADALAAFGKQFA